MYALLAALSILFPPPDLSNHWRWASASVNQSANSPTPIPPTPIPSPTPTPNPVPTPVPTPNPTPVLKPGDDCPGCTGGWIDSDGSAKVKCWKCNGDGRVDIGDPILTGATENPIGPVQGILPETKGNSIREDLKKTSPKETLATEQTPPKASADPDQTAICYKPKYSPEGYWILDPEANKWVRSAKQTPVTKQIATGHWDTRTKKVYTSCCGWQTQSYKVWVAGPNKTITTQSKPLASHYPVRNSWWTGCSSWRHLTTGPHAGKFDPAYLQKLSWEELQSLHSDHHEQLRGRGSVKWSYVNK